MYDSSDSAFRFHGRLGEFLGIILPNLALTIVTLGFYRFWATTRERQYFWSRTEFIDDHFEWTGTGFELFLGFVTALFIFILPAGVLYLILQGVLLRGQVPLAVGIGSALYIVLLYLTGVAMFRGLRYRLSRTEWHGIRGGSEINGFAYGWSWLWRNFVTYVSLGLMWPWTTSRLWRDRWRAMSFGPHAFESDPSWGRLMGNWILLYLAPILLLGIPAILVSGIYARGSYVVFDDWTAAAMIGFGALILAFVYIILPLIGLFYYATYMREVIGTMRIAGLEFAFTASTRHWLWLFIGNFGLYALAYLAALVPIAVLGLLADIRNPQAMLIGDNVVTLIIVGFALIIPITVARAVGRYRAWRFFVRHLEAGGEIDLSTLTQSTLRGPSQGEGLLDALDVGAI